MVDMTEEVTGTTALTIPDLQTKGDLVTVAVSQAAHDHIRQWSLTNRILSLHEAGHVVAAAAASIPVRTVDITAVRGGAVNGWEYWAVRDDKNESVSLGELRAKLPAAVAGNGTS